MSFKYSPLICGVLAYLYMQNAFSYGITDDGSDVAVLTQTMNLQVLNLYFVFPIFEQRWDGVGV